MMAWKTIQRLFKDRKGVAVDGQMRKFNAGQSAKDFVKELIPPIFVRLGKKIVK
jgi:hypothetical protein